MKDCAQPLQHIEHGIPPVFDERSEVLVLGTMPSPKSREAAFFYGHPQNRFWRVLAALFDEPVPEDNAERADLLATRLSNQYRSAYVWIFALAPVAVAMATGPCW